MALNLHQSNTYAEFFGLTEDDKALIAALSDPIPYNEEKRITVLRQTQLLDTDPQEPQFDRFTSFGQRLFGFPICAVSLVDVNRCWYKSKTGFNDIQWPRGQSFCTYAILPESPDVFVIEDALNDNPLYATFWQVATPPFVRFYAAAALVVEGVRVGTLCLADVKPHKFSMAERLNLLDLGSAVADLIAQRRKAYLQSNAERSTLMLTMMHGLRTPLFAVDIGMSVLTSERDTIKTSLERTDPSQGNANMFASTLDDISSSIGKLKMAVESTVVLGKALAVTTNAKQQQQPASPQQQQIAASDAKSSTALLANASVLEIDGLINQMKVISGLIGRREIQWDVDTLRNTLAAAVLLNGANNYNAVRSFPDAINFLLLAILTHIVTYDTSGEAINVVIAASQCSTMCASSVVVAAGSAMNLVKASSAKCSSDNNANNSSSMNVVDDTIECFICNSSNATVSIPHGNIVLTVRSRAIVSNLSGVQGVCPEALQFTSNLTLNPAITQIMDSIGGRYTQRQVPVPGQQQLDEYVCEIPFIATFTNQPKGILLPVAAAAAVAPAPAPRAVTPDNEPVAPAPMDLAVDPAAPSADPNPASGGSKRAKHGEHSSERRNSPIIPTLGVPNSDMMTSSSMPALSLNTSIVEAAVEMAVGSARRHSARAMGANSPSLMPPRQMRVLIVDDSTMIQKMLRKWLETAGCVVSCAPNGKLGLNMMMTNEYDLVLMDFLMPVMLGLDCLKEYTAWKSGPEYDRGVGFNKDMLVIGMSATASEEEQSFGFENGMHFYTSKPVNLETLKTTIHHKRKAESLEQCYDILAENNLYTARSSARSDSITSRDGGDGGACVSVETAAAAVAQLTTAEA